MNSKPGQTRWVFQWWEGDNGVFYPEAAYDELTQTQEALMKAKSWGEFQSLLPGDVFAELNQWVINDGEQIYWNGSGHEGIAPSELENYLQEIAGDEAYYVRRADEPFDYLDVWGASEGEFPYWLGYLIEDFPLGFLDKFGRQAVSMVSGSWHEFPMDRVDEMRCFLEPLGYQITKVVTEGL